MTKKIQVNQKADKVAAEKAKLDKLAGKTNRLLFSTQTVFPFKIFPTTVAVSEELVNITFHYFISSKRVFPILIKDITNVKSGTTLFFGSLMFEVRGYEQNPPPIKYLPRDDVGLVRKIVVGLVTAHKEKIDTYLIKKSELIKKLIEIGDTRGAAIP